MYWLDLSGGKKKKKSSSIGNIGQKQIPCLTLHQGEKNDSVLWFHFIVFIYFTVSSLFTTFLSAKFSDGLFLHSRSTDLLVLLSLGFEGIAWDFSGVGGSLSCKPELSFFRNYFLDFRNVLLGVIVPTQEVPHNWPCCFNVAKRFTTKRRPVRSHPPCFLDSTL